MGQRRAERPRVACPAAQLSAELMAGVMLQAPPNPPQAPLVHAATFFENARLVIF